MTDVVGRLPGRVAGTAQRNAGRLAAKEANHD